MLVEMMLEESSSGLAGLGLGCTLGVVIARTLLQYQWLFGDSITRYVHIPFKCIHLVPSYMSSLVENLAEFVFLILLEEPRDIAPDQTSNETVQSNEKDLEKGEPGSKKNNKVDQGDEDKRQIEADTNLVGWDGPDDPGDPQNWSKRNKHTITVFYATLIFCLNFSSSIFSTATMVTAQLHGVSNQI